MSERYPGGYITKNAPQPTGGESGVADGVWTLEQALEYKQAGNWPIPIQPVYVEDVFSTYLYTGNGSTQTITNGINLSGKGGLVWFKSRSGAYNHALIDTVRGGGQVLSSNATSAQANYSPQGISAFNSNGFTFGTTTAELNNSSNTYASWTFRKAEKFFDVVTYTGNGTTQTINHNLGSIPGCIIVKSASSGSYDWGVYHRSLGATKGVYLNTTQAEQTNNSLWNDTTPTSTQFTVGNSGGASSSTNANGVTYVAYLFAHDAGGFGLTGTDNVISCGSVTADGSGNATVNLGYEPQWILIKSSSATNNWALIDNMRGLPADGLDTFLFANSANAESSGGLININSTGFYSNATLSASTTYIYIAIRRGPMRTPTTGTSVFSVASYTGNSTNGRLIGSVTTDLSIFANPPANNYGAKYFFDRLRGGVASGALTSTSTGAQADWSSFQPMLYFDQNNALRLGNDVAAGITNLNPFVYLSYMFRRAPGFFDVVCYTGTGVTRTVAHNLGVAPEFMFVKQRSGTNSWICGGTILGVDGYLFLNGTDALDTQPAYWANTLPTATNFTVDTATAVNNTASTYVAYLFATVSGVSKVGSYTGTGTTQQINCGFTAGSRFVMIKRTDSTGDWYVWDSARGIVAGNDPYLLLNSTAAEVTNTDYVDTYSAGFEISSTAPAAINANGGTFIYLAIA